MRSRRHLVVSVAFAVWVVSCANVTESEEYLALETERDAAIEAVEELADQRAAVEQELTNSSEKLTTAQSAAEEAETRVSQLEAALEEEINRIEPYPPSMVEEMVGGCAGSDTAMEAPCRCLFDELEKTTRLEQLFEIAGELALSGLASGSLSADRLEDVELAQDLLDVRLDCFQLVGPGLATITVEGGEEIEIRSIQVVSGGAQSIGQANHRGVELAIEDYGSIHGHAVDVGSVIDGRCSPEGGLAAALDVLSEPDVLGVVGTSCSGAAATASPLLSAQGLVMISPSNTVPALTSDLRGSVGEDYQKGYYRTANNDLIQGKLAAEFAHDLGVTKVATVDDGDTYTLDLADGFAARWTEIGGEVVVQSTVARGQQDMGHVVAELTAAEPQLILLSLFPEETKQLITQMGTEPDLASVELVGIEALLSDDSFLRFPESRGMYFTGPDFDHTGVNEATGQSAGRVEASYINSYGEEPGDTFWAHAYDATTLLLTAIEAATVVDGDVLHIDQGVLRFHLARTSGFQGLTGVLTCDGFGDCGSGRSVVVLNDGTGDPVATRLNVVKSGPDG